MFNKINLITDSFPLDRKQYQLLQKTHIKLHNVQVEMLKSQSATGKVRPRKGAYACIHPWVQKNYLRLSFNEYKKN